MEEREGRGGEGQCERADPGGIHRIGDKCQHATARTPRRPDRSHPAMARPEGDHQLVGVGPVGVEGRASGPDSRGHGQQHVAQQRQDEERRQPHRARLTRRGPTQGQAGEDDGHAQRTGIAAEEAPARGGERRVPHRKARHAARQGETGRCEGALAQHRQDQGGRDQHGGDQPVGPVHEIDRIGGGKDPQGRAQQTDGPGQGHAQFGHRSGQRGRGQREQGQNDEFQRFGRGEKIVEQAEQGRRAATDRQPGKGGAGGRIGNVEQRPGREQAGHRAQPAATRRRTGMVGAGIGPVEYARAQHRAGQEGGNGKGDQGEAGPRDHAGISGAPSVTARANPG